MSMEHDQVSNRSMTTPNRTPATKSVFFATKSDKRGKKKVSFSEVNDSTTESEQGDRKGVREDDSALLQRLYNYKLAPKKTIKKQIDYYLTPYNNVIQT